MSEIIKTYRQSFPAMKFVGKCYSEKDKENGTFSNKWNEWFENELFAPLKLSDDQLEPFEDCDSFYGLCRSKENELFQYWIGVFMPLNTVVPTGYDSIDFEAFEVAVCWIYGKEPDIYFHCCNERLKEDGFKRTPDLNGAYWDFERYVCPRFTNPDEKGNVILDMCFMI